MKFPFTTFAAIAFAFFSAAMTHSARAGEPQPLANFDVSEIGPGNYVHYGSFDERSPANLGDNANIGFIVGKKCVLPVDAAGSLPVGRALPRAHRRHHPRVSRRHAGFARHCGRSLCARTWPQQSAVAAASRCTTALPHRDTG